MVMSVLKFFGYVLFFLLALMYFTPKVNLYYLLESKLKEKSIIIDKETLRDNGFTLSINNAKVNVKEIQSAKIEVINIKIFALYNSILLKNIELSSVASSIIPTKIAYVDVVYNILNPLQVKVKSVGDFGEIVVNLKILDGIFHLELNPSKVMLVNYRQTLRMFKKTQEGVYIYDKTIKY